MVAMASAGPELIDLLPAEEQERRERRAASRVPELWALLDTVMDPEIPVVSIWDLGILQDVRREGDEVIVVITPTYSGCPAMSDIETSVREAMAQAGHPRCRVEHRLAPAWSTRWILPEARERLRTYGIAPPAEAGEALTCPHCGASEVRELSAFGSTACKALYQCRACHEPFDHFKPF